MAIHLKTNTKDGFNSKNSVGSMAIAMHGYNETQGVFTPMKISDSGDMQISSIGGFSNYESKEIAPGASANGYDVKNTGGLFGTVSTSYRTIITNNDSSEDIIVYLNTDNLNPIRITSASTFEINNLGVTNIFIDTEVGHTGAVEIIIFG